MNLNKVIAIQNYGSSGTLFMQSLLDNHPDILSLPALYMREIFRFWDENYPFQSIEELIEKFILSPYHSYWFDPNPEKYQILRDNGLVTLGKAANEHIELDCLKFMKVLHAQLLSRNEISLKNLFQSVYQSYAIVKNKPIKENMWILFPIHANPKAYALQLIDLFDEVRFIHMLREPTGGIFSLVNHLVQTKNSHANIFSAAMRQIIFDVPHHSNERAFGLQSYVEDNDKVRSVGVRLEDLHANPQQVLQSLCHWLSIPWDDCLLTSTFDGKLWNNRQSSIQASGFNKSIVEQKYQQFANQFDYLRMRLLVMRHRLAFGYENRISLKQKILLFILPLLFIFPFKAEMIPTKKGKTARLGNYLQTRRILLKAYLNNFWCPFKFVKILPFV